MKVLNTPVTEDDINILEVGDLLFLSGDILCGRDTVLPKVVNLIENQTYESMLLKELLQKSVIFHTAVSIAGVGPTSSNKFEIESCIAPLSKAGVKIHLGKGQIHAETIQALSKYNSVYAVIAPVTALLNQKTISKELVAYGELGMEALYKLTVEAYPIIIASAHGRSIYDEG